MVRDSGLWCVNSSVTWKSPRPGSTRTARSSTATRRAAYSSTCTPAFFRGAHAQHPVGSDASKVPSRNSLHARCLARFDLDRAHARTMTMQRSTEYPLRADFHVGHAFRIEVSAVGFELHISRSDRIDMRIDRDAAEDEIARAHDVHMQRIGGAVGDLHRTG